MVTVRQFTRGTMRTMRAIDREAKRSEKRRVAYEKAAQKIAALEAAADAVAEYDDMIEQLTGAHRAPFEPLDWQAVASRPRAPAPAPGDHRERMARHALAVWRPGWFSRLFGLAGRKREALERAIAQAALEDRVAFDRACEVAARRNEETDFAARLLALDPDAIAEAVSQRSGLGNLPFCLEALDLHFDPDRQDLSAHVDGLDLEDMPTRSVTLLQSGKASVKALSPAKIQELHRANICASALRVGIELLRVVPIPAVEVVMDTDILDPGTGHIEPRPILRVKIARQAIASLTLSRTDAAAVIERLGGEMNWNNRRGFIAIADG